MKDFANIPVTDEEDSGYAETLYLSKDPRVKKEILEGMATPIEDCIPEDEVSDCFIYASGVRQLFTDAPHSPF